MAALTPLGVKNDGEFEGRLTAAKIHVKNVGSSGHEPRRRVYRIINQK
jgi:hypothetical protein